MTHTTTTRTPRNGRATRKPTPQVGADSPAATAEAGKVYELYVDDDFTCRGEGEMDGLQVVAGLDDALEVLRFARDRVFRQGEPDVDYWGNTPEASMLRGVMAAMSLYIRYSEPLLKRAGDLLSECADRERRPAAGRR